MRTITINGVDLRDQLGVHTNPREGLGALPGIAETEGTQPGRAGVVIDSDTPSIGPRDLTIAFDVKRASQAALDAVLAQLRALVTRGTLEVVYATLPTRAYFARLRQFAVTRVGPAYVTESAQGTISLRALDPFAHDLVPQLVVCGATPVALPQGTAPAWPLLRLTASTNPTVLTLRDATGATIGSMTLTAVLNAATEYLDIDMAAQSVTKYSSGVASDAYSLLSAGDFFALPAQDPTGGAPTLSVSAGSVLAIYRRAWL